MKMILAIEFTVFFFLTFFLCACFFSFFIFVFVKLLETEFKKHVSRLWLTPTQWDDATYFTFEMCIVSISLSLSLSSTRQRRKTIIVIFVVKSISKSACCDISTPKMAWMLFIFSSTQSSFSLTQRDELSSGIAFMSVTRRRERKSCKLRAKESKSLQAFMQLTSFPNFF